MAALTRSAAVISTHLALFALIFPLAHATPLAGEETCSPATTTVYTTVTVSASVNPNGPYDNPYDYTSLPFAWPGKPTSNEFAPPPKPSSPYSYGGSNADQYQAPAWVPVESAGSLSSSLPQSDTNGNSPWGLLDCPHLPWSISASPSTPSPSSYSASSSGKASGKTTSSSKSTSSGKSSGKITWSTPLPTSSGTPTKTYSSSWGVNSTWTSSSASSSTTWGGNSTNGACSIMPDTGVTRSYDFHVAYQTIAPDGVTKNGLVVNGGFPGPLIEANWGDWIQIHVTNDLDNEGTSLHWHGLLQSATPFFDGVPAVAQCPIAPGESLTYTFRADLYGTSWYHSHYSAQYAGGALGPIVIYGPKLTDYDIDMGPIILSDWFHQDYFTLVNNTMAGNIPPSNNNLINGKMNYPCQNVTLPCTPNAGISKFKFQSGKKHLLRLINTSAEGIQKFSIDGHNFTVIQNDFIPIQPYETNVITLGVGQRSDVIVEAIGEPNDSYWMRSNLGTFPGGCSFTDGISPEAVAAVYYEDADTNAQPTTNSSVTTTQQNTCANDDLTLTKALCPVPIQETPGTTETIDIVFGSNGTNFVWFMNNSSFRGDYNDPVLAEAKLGNLTFPDEWNVHNFGSNSSVRLIIKNTFQFGAHPMHLHGHNFNVLAVGFGDWDGTITNPSGTQMRDVQLLPPAQDANTPAFIVIQWNQDNAAVWPLHCHIAWHVSAGLYINVLELPDQIKAMDFPSSVGDTCRSWAAWTGTNIPDQIDSGL